MKWYPWLTSPYKEIIHHYLQRSHHALLLQIPLGFGEEKLVNALAKRLLCKSPQDEKNCGQCRSCQLIEAHHHPDYFIIQAEANKKHISVEQIRLLITKLCEHSQQGGAKIISIMNAEFLTTAAANALLKCLEEPPSKTYFILTNQHSAKLLATIKSRCLQWRLCQPPENYAVQWLAKALPNKNSMDCIVALRLSSGSPLLAKDLLTSERWQLRRTLIEHLAQAIMQANMFNLLAKLNDNNSIECLDWCLIFWQDILKYQLMHGANLINQDMHNIIVQLANHFTPLALQAIYQDWLTCRQQLLTISGVNRALLIGDLLIKTEQLYCH